MRFCNMNGQDSIGHLENEIHFQRAALTIALSRGSRKESLHSHSV
jgi:hypothetical protein